MRRIPSLGLCLFLTAQAVPPPLSAELHPADASRPGAGVHAADALRQDAERLRSFQEALAQTPPDPRTLAPGAFGPVVRPLQENLKKLKEQTPLYPTAVDVLEEEAAGAENLSRFAAAGEANRLELGERLLKIAGSIDRLVYDLEAAGFAPGKGGPPGTQAQKAAKHPVDRWLPGAVDALQKFQGFGEVESVQPGQVRSMVAFKNGRKLIIQEDGTIVEQGKQGELLDRGMIRPSSQRALAERKGVADIEVLWGDREQDEIVGMRQSIDFDSGKSAGGPVLGKAGNAISTVGPIDAAIFALFAPALTLGVAANEVKTKVGRDVREAVYEKARTEEIENPVLRGAAEFGIDVAMSKPVEYLLDFGPGVPSWIKTLYSNAYLGRRSYQIAEDVKVLWTAEDEASRKRALSRLTKNSLHLGKSILGMRDSEPAAKTASTKS